MSISVMKKLTVISPSGEEDAVIKRLIRQRCVQVKTAQTDDYGYLLENLNCDTRRNQVEKKIATLERILPVLAKRTQRKGKLGDKRLKVNRDEFISDGRYDAAWEVACRANDSLIRISECRSEIQSVSAEISSLLPWVSYDVEANLGGTVQTDITLGVFPIGTKISAIETTIGELLGSIEIVSEDASGVYAVIITYKHDTDDVLRELSSQLRP